MMNTPTLSEYIDATRDTLQYWLDIHTNPEKWAQEWNIDDDWQYTLKNCPKIENSYFEFDLKAACAKEYARQFLHTFRICSKCGDMLEDQYTCENCGSERTRKVKIGDGKGCILLTVRQSHTIQEVRVFSHDLQATKLAIARALRDNDIPISFNH